MTDDTPQRVARREGRVAAGSSAMLRRQYHRQLQQQQAQHDPHRASGRALPEKQNQVQHNRITDGGDIPTYRHDQQ